MTLALVTGGTGFIGANVVRALLDDGVEVRVLMRAESSERNLRGLELQRAVGDLVDAASVERAVEGVDVVFHVAALYELTVRDRPRVITVNVQGTRNVMRAALRAGVERVVHTSSVAAVGHAHWESAASGVRSGPEERRPLPASAWRRNDAAVVPASELDWADSGDFAGPYEESKYLSERLVHDMVERDGLQAVVVNPTAPIGPLDVKPTPTGRLIVDAANGSMPGYLRSAGLNIVDVRDVARGHLLAWRRGRVGERYILGHQEGNLSLREVMLRAAQAAEGLRKAAGRPRGRGMPGGWRRPLLPLPYAVAMGYAQLDERLMSRLRGRPPRAPIAGVRLARYRMWYDCRKAVQELDLPQSSLPQALADAVEYFRSRGMVQA